MTTPTMEQRRADFEDMLKRAARDIITTVAEAIENTIAAGTVHIEPDPHTTTAKTTGTQIGDAA